MTPTVRALHKHQRDTRPVPPALCCSLSAESPAPTEGGQSTTPLPLLCQTSVSAATLTYSELNIFLCTLGVCVLCCVHQQLRAEALLERARLSQLLPTALHSRDDGNESKRATRPTRACLARFDAVDSAGNAST